MMSKAWKFALALLPIVGSYAQEDELAASVSQADVNRNIVYYWSANTLNTSNIVDEMQRAPSTNQYGVGIASSNGVVGNGFNCKGATNDFCVGFLPELFNGTNTQISYSYWARRVPSTIPTNNAAIMGTANQNFPTVNTNHLQINFGEASGNQLTFLYVWNGWITNYIYVSSTNVQPTNAWVHVAARIDLLTLTNSQVWVNASRVPTAIGTSGVRITSFRGFAKPVYLGSLNRENSPTAEGYMQGNYDEVRMYTGLITDAEVTQLFRMGKYVMGATK